VLILYLHKIISTILTL